MRATYGICCILLYIALSVASTTREEYEISNILDNIKKGYNKSIRPYFDVAPVKVGVTMYFLDFHSISEKNKDFTIEMYFRQFWRDPRLAYRSGPNSLELPTNFLWIPDTFIPNEKSSAFHYVTTPNVFTRVTPDGYVLMSTRLSVTASCPMNFRFFPMDTQTCKLEFESYGRTMSDIIYEWHKGPQASVGLSPEVQLDQYKFLGYRTKTYEIRLSTGNYSRLACELLYERSLTPYAFSVYLPCGLIVALSWLSFWLGTTKRSARAILGTVTLLIIIQFISNARLQFPTTSYLTVIDVYLMTCLIFVALVLVEFAVVFYVAEYDCEENILGPSKNARCQINASRIDTYSKIIFPALFIAFNFLYWIITITLSKVEHRNLVPLATN